MSGIIDKAKAIGTFAKVLAICAEHLSDAVQEIDEILPKRKESQPEPEQLPTVSKVAAKEDE